MRIHNTLPLVLAFTSVACEPGPSPEELDAFAERWATTTAAFEARCITPHSLHGTYGRAAEPTLASIEPPPATLAEREATFRGLFDNDTRALDPSALDRCLDAHDALPACPVDPYAFFARAGCNLFVVGARQDGDRCADTWSCAPGLFCDQASAFECGRCEPGRRPDFGDDIIALRLCDDDPMCGLDVAPDVAGAACTANCGYGLYPAHHCVEGVCVERHVADVGKPCDGDVPFGAGLAHCRDKDFGSTVCGDDVEGDGIDGRVCAAVQRDVPPGAFVPGAEVVSAVAGAAAPLECAP